jgi:hypothetical protein
MRRTIMNTEERVITVTLSRAHKIADRIGSKVAEARAYITASKAGGVAFSNRPTPEQVAALIDVSAKAFAAIDEAAKLIEVLAQLRDTIGKANAASGVNTLLTRIEANKRLIKLYADTQEVLTRPHDAVHVNDLNDFTWPESTGNRYTSKDPIVTTVTIEDLEGLTKKKAALERETFALQDQLSDFNATKVQVTLPADVAAMIGL